MEAGKAGASFKVPVSMFKIQGRCSYLFVCHSRRESAFAFLSVLSETFAFFAGKLLPLLVLSSPTPKPGHLDRSIAALCDA
jgi:hypothetical protein